VLAKLIIGDVHFLTCEVGGNIPVPAKQTTPCSSTQNVTGQAAQAPCRSSVGVGAIRLDQSCEQTAVIASPPAPLVNERTPTRNATPDVLSISNLKHFNIFHAKHALVACNTFSSPLGSLLRFYCYCRTSRSTLHP